VHSLDKPPPSPRRRRLLAGAASVLALGLAACRSATPKPDTGRLRRIAEGRWSHRLHIEGTSAGGLSGIDYDPIRGEYLLISDDRSDLDPVRYYIARWSRPNAAQLEPVSVVQLQRPGGGPWPNRRHAVDGLPVPDPEALRLRPATNTLLWTSEGDVARGFGPALYESARDGRFLREFPVPAMFRPDPAQHRGPRDNLTFEGITLTPDGRFAWLGMENALFQDGPEPTVGTPGGPCRFTRIDLQTGQPDRQVAYVPGRHPAAPAGARHLRRQRRERDPHARRRPHAGAGARLRHGHRQLAAPVRDRHPRGQRRARRRRAGTRQPPPGGQDPGGRLRHAGPVPPRQHRGHVLGPAAARWQSHAGGRERRQFQPASSDPVRRLRIHRQQTDRQP
jgi:hypothetical protein